MNEENKQKPEIGLSVLTHVIAFALITVAFSLGVMLQGCIPNAAYWRLAVFLTMVLLALISGFTGPLVAKRFSGLSVEEANQEADDRMRRMAMDAQKEWNKVRFLCMITTIYIALLWILCLSLAFFHGVTGDGAKRIGYLLIPFFMLSGLVGRLVHPIEKMENPDALPECDFPQLYALAREVGAQHLANREVSICVMDSIPEQECSAAVVIGKKRIIILLGAVLLCIVDEAELKQVLLHEIAHMHKEQLGQDRYYGRIMSYLTGAPRSVFGGLSNFALGLPTLGLAVEGQFYFLFSNRMKEVKADQTAAENGEMEKQASVLAKIHAHDLYNHEQEPYVNIFTSETVPQHLMTDRAGAYRAALLSRGAAWKEILEHELPSRVATHPTFRQRWEALGCCNYSMEPASLDTPFAQECWAAAGIADARRAAFPQERYAQLRQEAYCTYEEIRNEWESSDREWTPEELREPMIAYFHLGEPDKMETLCDRIINGYDNPFVTAFARYWKGVLLLSRYDSSGLDYLYQAMEANTNYIEDGLERIGRYCTQMGLQEELDEYRRRAPDYLQTKKDRQSEGIVTGAKLSREELPEGWLDRIREYILNVGGETVQEIYLVKHRITDDYAPSAFVIRFTADAPQDTAEETYNKTFALLDDWPEDWEFSLYVYEDDMKKPLSTVAESCIYRKKDSV